MPYGNQLPPHHILATMKEKTRGPGRFNCLIGKQLQDFNFTRLKLTALLQFTWELKSAT